MYMQVSADNCTHGERVNLEPGLWMVCTNGTWVEQQVRSRNGPQTKPCEDLNNTCSANSGHCHQYTAAGAEMTRDCPGTCGQMLCRQIIIC